MPVSIAGDGTLTGVDPALSGFGRVLQIVGAQKTDTQVEASVAAGATFTVTGLTATITPTSASNNILVFCDITIATDSAVSLPMGVIVKRGGTAIGVGDAAGSRTPVTFTAGGYGNRPGTGAALLIDSPATTSATTYTVDVMQTRSTATQISVNADDADPDASYIPRTASRLILVEVAA